MENVEGLVIRGFEGWKYNRRFFENLFKYIRVMYIYR